MNKVIALGAILIGSGATCVAAHAGDVDPGYRAQVNADLDWPITEKATRKKGAFVPVANVVKITPGMSKKQIYTLLDVPHFSEGLFGVKTWNYILNFYTGQGNDYVSCQYHIRFDRDYRVEATYWQTQQCADLVTKLSAAPKADVVEKIIYVDRPVSAPAPAAYQRNYVVTFDTGSFQLDTGDIDVVEAAVATARATGKTDIKVLGHTDTVGDERLNAALRERRANAVAYAVKRVATLGGYNVSVSTGTSADLAVPTSDEVPEEANRRVTIQIN